MQGLPTAPSKGPARRCPLWFALLLGFSATSAHSAGSNRTIAHEALELERELGSDAVDVAHLERLLDETLARIGRRVPRDRREARRLLTRIDREFSRRGIVRRPGLLLHRVLRANTADCDQRTLLYVALGERAGWPVGAARVEALGYPHLVVRYTLPGGRELLWETLEGRARMAAEPGRVVRLTRGELRGLLRFNAGVAWGRRGDWRRSLARLDGALALDPSAALAHRARADVLLRRALSEGDEDDLRAARRSIDRAILHDASASDAYVIRAIVLHHLDGERPLDDLRSALRRDRTNPAAQYYLGLVLLDRERLGAAIRAFGEAIRLGGERRGDAYARRLALHARYYRGLAYERRAERGAAAPTDLRRARADVAAFLNRVPHHADARALAARLDARAGWNTEGFQP